MAVTREEIVIGSKADTRGFKKAETAADKLAKSVKALGVGLSAYAAVDFAKTSLKAFIADEAAANKLALAVKNLGMEFANPYIADYISQMESSKKIADDELRPAFQALLTTTGSLAKSQSILNTAIEASRGSGYDLATVSNDLAQAYVGNTKGLKKYYLGLDQAALKAASFTDIQKIMNNQFTGSSAAYLNTYSGQVGVLSLAWGNFQEKVGGTLITLASFGDGENGTKLNLLAASLDKIGSAIQLIGKGKEAIFGLFNLTGKNGLLSKFNPYAPPAPADKKTDKSLTKYEAMMAKIEKDRKAYYDSLIKSNKQLTDQQKKQEALKKAGTVFDKEQINLIAALKGKLSEEDKIRAEAQLALLNGNEVLATSLTKKILMAQDKSGELYKYFLSIGDAKIKNPFEFLDKWVVDFQDKLNAVKFPTMPDYAGIGLTMSSLQAQIAAGQFTSLAAQGAGASGGFSPVVAAAMTTPTAAPTVVVNVGGSVTTSQNLIDEIRGGLNVAALSGSSANVERRIGGW